MKQALVFVALLLATVACQTAGSQQKEAKTALKSAKEGVIVTPDDLFGSPEKFEGQMVTVKGLCVHTCKHSGKRLFMQGKDQDQLLLVVASADIAQFDRSLEGSNVIVSGTFTNIAEADTPHEHQSEEGACETESKAKNYQVTCQTVATAE